MIFFCGERLIWVRAREFEDRSTREGCGCGMGMMRDDVANEFYDDFFFIIFTYLVKEQI